MLLQRPVYQTALAFLTLLALAGSVWLLATQGSPTGVAIVRPTPDAQATPTAIAADPAVGTRLNINTASAAELDDALPGIGPVLSQRIVAFREANGPFSRIDQIMTVPGIGDATFANLQSLITVSTTVGE